MAATRSSRPKKKEEHSIPVKIVAGSSPRPSSPPLEIATPKPVAKKVPTKPVAQPISEQQRRQTLRWVVGIGALVILGGWIATVKYEVAGSHSQSNILSEIIHSFKALNLNKTSTPSPKQKEVQQYQQQVFPQFTNQ